MGAVFRPRDLARGRKRIIENMLKDIQPDNVDEVIALLSSWEGQASEEKLKERLGQEKAKSLLDLIEKKKKV
jgi:DNA-directed RNA polymerase subunit F